MIEGVGLLPYSERLQVLQLTTLAERRSRGDLIEVWKASQGFYSYTEGPLLEDSRSSNGDPPHLTLYHSFAVIRLSPPQKIAQSNALSALL
ncbi:hypothetical protein ACHWQZ_G011915 [Mnemiopsis leidyi]